MLWKMYYSVVVYMARCGLVFQVKIKNVKREENRVRYPCESNHLKKKKKKTRDVY